MNGQPHKSAALSHSTSSGRQRTAYLILALVAVLGTYDVAQFLGTNTGMFSTAPGRAAGSVLGLVLWIAFLAGSGAAAAGWRSNLQRLSLLVLGWLLFLGNAALTWIHAAAHVGGLRPAVGGVLGVIALALLLLVRRREGRSGHQPAPPPSENAPVAS